jgi:uncharacterized protein (TIGR02246 family)
MTKSAIAFLICLYVLSFGASVTKAADAEAAVEEIWRQYSSRLNAGDLDGWMNLWADDGIQMPPNAPPVIGKNQIRAKIQETLDRFTFDITISNAEVRATDGWAFARGTYKATLTPRQNGQVVHIDGKYMTILQRESNGAWKIFRDIFNSNVPTE